MNDNDIVFSIIVPVYNIKNYIGECVESLEQQDMTNYEVILVDDGSSDGSAEICDKLKMKNDNIVVIHKKNGGLSDARNTGLKNAKGEYILYVDGDDYIQKNVLKKIYNKILNNNFPDLICLECKKFFEGQDNKISMNDGISEKIESLKSDEICKYIGNLPKYPASASTKAIRRKFCIDNNLYFEKGLLSEDLEWASRVFLNINSAAYLCDDYYFYRQARVGSICNTVSEKNILDILYITEKWFEKLGTLKSDNKKFMLQSFIEYNFRTLISGYSIVVDKKKYKSRLKKLEFALGTRKDKKSMLIAKVYKICGIRIISTLLIIYLRLRKKIRSINK